MQSIIALAIGTEKICVSALSHVQRSREFQGGYETGRMYKGGPAYVSDAQ